MEKWLRDRLSTCLDFEVPNEMIKYILSLKSSQEFDDYFETLLNKECEDHRMFLTDCKQRLFNFTLPNKKANSNQSQQQQNKQNVKKVTSKPQPPSQPQQQNQQQYQQQIAKKKATKYVNLYSKDGKVAGETIMLKGRRLCDCEAAEHKLINNCLSCGRIVCDQEGSGPCLFCGEVVCTNLEAQVVKSGTKKGDHLLKSLKEKGGGESLKKAMEQRDRLLEYDRSSEMRTTVIDDEFDYFQENSVWLSDIEREKFERLKQDMQEKKHAGRANRQFKVDFAGRQIDDDDIQITEDYERNVLQEVSTTDTANNWSNRKLGQKTLPVLDPNSDAARPIYNATAEGKVNDRAVRMVGDGLERIYNRVQDKELLEMQDMRQCLSMHQPYASLLVAGIKKHEGRIWYTEHRGRLWIASTVKEARPDDIKEVENFYKAYYGDDNISFPEHYPTGCLLGCVKVDECLPQEEYREVCPNGESESPYVFVCSNPEQLSVNFPIKGQQKIYQIDPKIHNAACKTLLRQRPTKG